MKKILLLTAILFTSVQFFAQEMSKDIGLIGEFEMNYNKSKAPQDTDAVILFDIGRTKFVEANSQPFIISFTRKTRIKILDKKALDQAEIAIRFYNDGKGDTERIDNIQAFTYNFSEGRMERKELKKENIFTEKVNKHWSIVKFVLPDVKEGSIIEYEYEKITPFLSRLPEWEFQNDIHTLYSEYQAFIIPFYEYEFIAQGIRRFAKRDNKKMVDTRNFGGVQFSDIRHTFVMENIPAFVEEGFITTPEDHLVKIIFELSKFHTIGRGTIDVMSTWEGINNDLIKSDYFGRYMKRLSKSAKKILASEIDLDGKDKTQQARTIIEYVRNTYEWNEFRSLSATAGAKKILQSKTGNVADINLLLCALLNEAGIKTEPVIISTRDHGKVRPDYPFMHYFNYIILKVNVDNVSFLTDATEHNLAFNRIPIRAINGQGLVINPDEQYWIKLDQNILSTKYTNIEMNIDADEMIANARTDIRFNEYESVNTKSRFYDDEDKLKDYYLGKGFEEIEELSTKNYEDPYKNYSVRFKAKSDIEIVGNKILLNPFFKLAMQNNTFTAKKRTYPIDFRYCIEEVYTSRINIPEGYKLADQPEDYTLENDLMIISITYKLQNDIIVAQANFKLKNSKYHQRSYGRIKTSFNKIISSFNKQLILEKKI